jgi:flagellar biosynthesis/type III secretory pathway chaperone
MEKLDKIKHYFALKIEKIMEEKKSCMKNIETLQGEIKNQQTEQETVVERERQSNIKLMEKTAEFTVRMNDLLNVKGNQFLL